MRLRICRKRVGVKWLSAARDTLQPNVPGELRPTEKSARTSPKASAVGRQLHWVVRRGDDTNAESLPSHPYGAAPYTIGVIF